MDKCKSTNSALSVWSGLLCYQHLSMRAQDVAFWASTTNFLFSSHKSAALPIFNNILGYASGQKKKNIKKLLQSKKTNVFYLHASLTRWCKRLIVEKDLEIFQTPPVFCCFSHSWECSRCWVLGTSEEQFITNWFITDPNVSPTVLKGMVKSEESLCVLRGCWAHLSSSIRCKSPTSVWLRRKRDMFYDCPLLSPSSWKLCVDCFVRFFVQFNLPLPCVSQFSSIFFIRGVFPSEVLSAM